VTEPASAAYRWDPAQYVRYSDERGRPFHELVARIPADAPLRAVDIGCGPGSLTATLAARWPTARITGIDSSPDMIAAATAAAEPGRIEFHEADLRDWRPDDEVDVVVANAVLQWVPGHLGLLPHLAGWLAPGGSLAFQVPDNFAEPSHTIVRDLCESPRWRERLGPGGAGVAAVERPTDYLRALADAGLSPDVWQTSYLHVLPGDDAVLEWIKGTALRPVLAALDGDADATSEFLAECGAALREAYPRGLHGTVFPFRRTFAVAQRR
jgi:trans-aconitate 2-methyltransferase